MKIGRKIILSVLVLLFTAPLAFCQSEVLKVVVNHLAYYKQRKELRFLTNAKKSIDSIMKITMDQRLDTNNLEKKVYIALINSAILYVDSTNKTGQPENLFRKTIEQVDILDGRSRIFKYQPEMDFAKQCLANVYIRKGFAYLTKLDYANALEMYKKAYRFAPNFKPLNKYMAFTNQRMNNPAAAAKSYDILSKTDSLSTDYIEAAANVYKTIGDTTKAIELIKKGRKAMPNDKALLLIEANIYANRKDYRSLEPLLPQLLDNNINNPDIVFVAANCYDKLKQYDKAESLYLRAIDLNGSAYESVFNLGLLYLKKSAANNSTNKDKNLTFAQQWLEKANEMSPNDVKCLEVLKMLYGQTGNNDQITIIDNKLKQITNQ
ncbi:tetratricopeptide repeat protein [Mucilaginibacter antarcticus]|uniref:Tetratricopeptide repeat protein n=2 Tax=Mucilaginibacter antarcticus TaxID=1855725 RepID=A0ABW5XUV0_9SPHI